MRAVITGQSGLDKKRFLNGFRNHCRKKKQRVRVFHVGDMMYKEDPSITRGEILKLPKARLDGLRRSVFKVILKSRARNIIVDTHATFRHNNGLFLAYDFDQLKDLKADTYIILLDNLDAVYARLQDSGKGEHSLRDILAWREEETMATEIVANILVKPKNFFILARGRGTQTHETLYSLLFERKQKKRVYASFPMTYVQNEQLLLDQITNFKKILFNFFIVFDPADMDEKRLDYEASLATENKKDRVKLETLGKRRTFRTDEIAEISR
jgi:adenylate kinase